MFLDDFISYLSNMLFSKGTECWCCLQSWFRSRQHRCKRWCRQSQLLFDGRRGDNSGLFLKILLRLQDDLLQADHRTGTIRFVDDLLKTVVSHNVEAVDHDDAGLFAVGEAQTAPDRLFDEDASIGGAQRHNGVEVGDVPPLFEHAVDALHR